MEKLIGKNCANDDSNRKAIVEFLNIFYSSTDKFPNSELEDLFYDSLIEHPNISPVLPQEILDIAVANARERFINIHK